MPNFLIDEDTDLLAAEFVLGTLDAEERANAQSLLRIDHASSPWCASGSAGSASCI